MDNFKMDNTDFILVEIVITMYCIQFGLKEDAVAAETDVAEHPPSFLIPSHLIRLKMSALSLSGELQDCCKHDASNKREKQGRYVEHVGYERS